MNMHLLTNVPALLAPLPALTGVSGLTSGLLHPVLGFDHLLAMVAVGILSVQMGHKHIWSLPAVFVASLAVGGIMGLVGIGLVEVEGIIALSVVILGLSIVTGAKNDNLIVYPMVAIFAIFHGHAHGQEVPSFSDPAIYVAGFLIASAALHLLGVFIGFIFKNSRTRSLIGAGCVGIGLHMILLTYNLV